MMTEEKSSVEKNAPSSTSSEAKCNIPELRSGNHWFAGKKKLPIIIKVFGTI
jgi:hypothetical protein